MFFLSVGKKLLAASNFRFDTGDISNELMDQDRTEKHTSRPHWKNILGNTGAFWNMS